MYADISYFLLDVRAKRSDRAWVPCSIYSFEKYSIFVYFTCNNISCTQISHIFFWMLGRTSPAVREFRKVSIPLKNTLSSCTLHAISSHVRRYLLFSFGCSGEPVQSCESSLKYRFLWKILHIRVLYMDNIISYPHISAIFIWIFGRTGPAEPQFPEV